MNANKLLTNIPTLQILGNRDFLIDFLCFDSRKSKENSVYFAIKGNEVDGHLYINSAIEKGASMIVCEVLPETINEEICYILVKDSQKTMALMAKNFYENPSEKLNLIGITGTNGKTSSATLSFDVFTKMGAKCALISTVENRIVNEIIHSTHTTPDIITINHLLARAVEKGVEYAFMEVSSHGLHQKRTQGLDFKIAAFTNISHDHLDYHLTFQEYLNCKKTFFDNLSATSIAISNADDKNGTYVLQNTKATKKYFATKTLANYKAKVIENDFNGMLLELNSLRFWTKLTGKFNVSNLLLVFAIAKELGKEETEILTAMSLLERVKGRFETLKSNSGIYFVIDYAHTPDALENVMKSINELRTKNEQFICVFGCGGNRDTTKRPIMGKIATQLANLSIITSDNPRYEETLKIIDDIKSGVESQNFSKYIVVPDRKEAIKTAIQMAKTGDIVLVAGKGHENYQEINGIKHHFDDAENILELIQLLKK